MYIRLSGAAYDTFFMIGPMLLFAASFWSYCYTPFGMSEADALLQSF